MSTYIYNGSFPVSPSIGETLEMNDIDYIYTSKGAWEVREGQPGIQGLQGIQGVQGIQGIKGETGADSVVVGPRGLKGEPVDNITTASTIPTHNENPPAIGHIWIDTSTGSCYICIDASTDNNVWTDLAKAGVESVSGGIVSSYIEPVVHEGAVFTVAEGGTKTIVGDYAVHTFKSSSYFTVETVGDEAIEVLCVAGGGGGGTGQRFYVSSLYTYGQPGGGAGGAGQLWHSLCTNFLTGSYYCRVGAGGTSARSPYESGWSGSASSIGGPRIVTCHGGGGGGGRNHNGIPGGSGGGAGNTNDGGSYYGAYSTNSLNNGTAFGNEGGRGYGITAGTGSGGGSGGPGAPGAIGGLGKTFSISGTATDYAGGGGSGVVTESTSGGFDGSAGGGRGYGDLAGRGAKHGRTNSGSGGGAGGGSYAVDTNGGSGIIIFRYKIK